MHPMHRSMCPIHRLLFVKLWLSTSLLRFGRLLVVVWLPSMMYFGLCYCFLCLFVSGFPRCSLPMFTHVIVFWVLVAQNTPQTTFTGGPPDSWHPCHESFGPHLRFNFEIPKSCLLFFLAVISVDVSIKK
jgi:hypothetical protein